MGVKAANPWRKAEKIGQSSDSDDGALKLTSQKLKRHF